MTQQGNGSRRSEPSLQPDAISCYGYAWYIVRKKFLELLLVTIIAVFVSLPAAGLTLHEDIPCYLAIQLFVFSLLYVIFLLKPLEYGVNYAFLRAVRGEDVQVGDIFKVFKNYLNAILANVLVAVIIGIGTLCCIVPGIVFACKLAFVPYLIVDRKLDAIQAVRESWKLTTGHAVTIFFIGVASLPIYIAGLMLCFVGILFSSMWVKSTFASMYLTVTGPRTSEHSV